MTIMFLVVKFETNWRMYMTVTKSAIIKHVHIVSLIQHKYM